MLLRNNKTNEERYITTHKQARIHNLVGWEVIESDLFPRGHVLTTDDAIYIINCLADLDTQADVLAKAFKD